MRWAIVTCLLLCSVLAFADDRRIDFQANMDFSTIGTFAVREGKSLTDKPELNNPLFLKRLATVIRAGLLAKGLTEASDRPDIFVDYSVAGLDLSTVERNPGTRIPDTPGMRGMVVPGTGPQTVFSSEGTLIVDLTLRETGVLIWRGVYRDEEKNPSRLAKKLPEDARKLLSLYSVKKK